MVFPIHSYWISWIQWCLSEVFTQSAWIFCIDHSISVELCLSNSWNNMESFLFFFWPEVFWYLRSSSLISSSSHLSNDRFFSELLIRFIIVLINNSVHLSFHFVHVLIRVWSFNWSHKIRPSVLILQLNLCCSDNVLNKLFLFYLSGSSNLWFHLYSFCSYQGDFNLVLFHLCWLFSISFNSLIKKLVNDKQQKQKQTNIHNKVGENNIENSTNVCSKQVEGDKYSNHIVVNNCSFLLDGTLLRNVNDIPNQCRYKVVERCLLCCLLSIEVIEENNEWDD